MDMGVEVEAPGVGVQDRAHAEFGPQMPGSAAKVLQSRAGRGEQNAVQHGLMTPGEGPEFAGQSESGHEVLDRQEFGPLAVEPHGSGMVLTLGTTAVAARAGALLLCGTCGAAQLYRARIGCAAAAYCTDGPQVTGQQAPCVAGFECGEVMFDEGSGRWWRGWRGQAGPGYGEDLSRVQADGWQNCAEGNGWRLFF